MEREFKGYEELHRQQTVSLHAEMDELRKQMVLWPLKVTMLKICTIIMMLMLASSGSVRPSSWPRVMTSDASSDYRPQKALGRMRCKLERSNCWARQKGRIREHKNATSRPRCYI